MREGHELVGWGMATGVWEAQVMDTQARATIHADGTLEVASATSDIGTGTYTVMGMMGADMFGLPIEKVRVKLGDSTMPTAPVEGGSWAAASTCSAIKLACQALKRDLLKHAQKDQGQSAERTSIPRTSKLARAGFGLSTCQGRVLRSRTF